MNPERIAEQFRAKGFTKQAALLGSGAGHIYLLALLQDRWEEHVSAGIGQDAVAMLNIGFIRNPHLAKLGSCLKGAEDFTPRDLDVSPLEIELTGSVNAEDILKAGEIRGSLAKLSSKGNRILYSELYEKAFDDEDLLYEIYKDREKFFESRDYFYSALLNRTERAARMLDIDAPTDILPGMIKLVCDLIGPGDDSVWKYFTELESCIEAIKKKRQDSKIEECWEAYGKITEKGLEVLEKARNDTESTEEMFQAWVDERKRTARQRIISKAKDEIRHRNTEEDSGLLLMDKDEEITAALLEHDEDSEFAYAGKPDSGSLARKLLKSPINCRQYFIDMNERHLEGLRRALTGFKQIIEGGPVTNPEVPEVSSMQNHAGFANIKYSDKTRHELERIVGQMDGLFRDMPDISALPTPSKLKRKKSLKYLIEEMPKDPLDVTFGNDSGCCIFVDENPENIQNGGFVPCYLLHPGVRLFGIYRTEGGKRQRMGLVLAFETSYEDSKNSRHGNVLACNSLELSRLGIGGGDRTIDRIVSYAEDWLSSYAEENGYDGVCMGGHSYNTSANYSSKTGETIKETLIFNNHPLNFYSDILEKKDKHTMATRKGSCYWLWRKE